MHDTVFNQGLQNKIRHFHIQKRLVYFIFAVQERVPAAHQLEISLYQTDLMAYRHHLAVRLHTQPEKINHLHDHGGYFLISVQFRLNPDSIQRIIKEMRVDLVFQIEQGHPLLLQFRLLETYLPFIFRFYQLVNDIHHFIEGRYKPACFIL